jgi:hypothetical protein
VGYVGNMDHFPISLALACTFWSKACT